KRRLDGATAFLGGHRNEQQRSSASADETGQLCQPLALLARDACGRLGGGSHFLPPRNLSLTACGSRPRVAPMPATKRGVDLKAIIATTKPTACDANWPRPKICAMPSVT